MKKADDFDVDIQACSATDCTGLIPSLPQDEAELESYKALYPFDAEQTAKANSGQIPRTAAPPEASSGGVS